jgi:signal transduction histidine kinase
LRSYVVAHPSVFIRHAAQVKAKQENRDGDLVFELVDIDAIHFSEESLKKIIDEVMDNACKFSAPGTPIIVQTRVESNAEDGSDQYVIAITNRGRGMTPEQIADVGAYMQFQRKLYEQQGSGLGLSLVRGLLELNGGHMTIDSIPDRETTVILTFPITANQP